VINFTAEAQRGAVNDAMALMARILANFWCFNVGIASMTQCPIVVANEARIGQFLCAQLTAEAIGMPAGLHGFNNTPNNNFAALVAVWRKKHTEVLLAVLPALKFVENSVLELTEALSATENILFNF
jgi:hypothetical protein